MFSGPTGWGKTHLILELIEKEYGKHFDYIIMICPTLRCNKIYHTKVWTKHDDKVWLIEPKDKLYQMIKKLSQLLVRSETLFIIDDIIADKSLDKRRQYLLELAISVRHCNHYSWLLTQPYSAIPKNIRRQSKVIFVWYLRKGQILRWHMMKTICWQMMN